MAKRRQLTPEQTKLLRDTILANPTAVSLDIIQLCAAQGQEFDRGQVSRYRHMLRVEGHKLPALPKGGSVPRAKPALKPGPKAAKVMARNEALEPLGKLTKAEADLLELACDIGLGRAALILEHAHHAFRRTIRQLQESR